jgi:site-specific DNA-methyltransferase (adenine-specific)/modification methylase
MKNIVRPLFRPAPEPLRVEKIGNATLFLGDCREIMPSLHAVDAILTDPPYGKDFKHSGGGKGGNPRLARVLRNSAPIIGDDKPFDPAHLLALGVDAILWGANHYADRLPASMGWLVWDKLEWSTPDTFSDCELAWHRDGTKVRKLPLMWKGVRVASAAREECTAGQQRLHPMQKPVALLLWCLSFIRRAEVILDPYMGSGSAGIACLRDGRKYLGIEIDERWFDIACQRIEQEARQSRMNFT